MRRLKDGGLPEIISPHSFRVLVVTNLLSQNVPMEDVQYLAGHSNPQTTRLGVQAGQAGMPAFSAPGLAALYAQEDRQVQAFRPTLYKAGKNAYPTCAVHTDCTPEDGPGGLSLAGFHGIAMRREGRMNPATMTHKVYRCSLAVSSPLPSASHHGILIGTR